MHHLRRKSGNTRNVGLALHSAITKSKDIVNIYHLIKRSTAFYVSKHTVCQSRLGLYYLHGVPLAIHRVLRARARTEISPVQVELQAIIDARETTSTHAQPPSFKHNFH